MNDFNEAALEAALLAMRGGAALKPTHLIVSAPGARLLVGLTFGHYGIAKRRGVRGRRAALYGRRS